MKTDRTPVINSYEEIAPLDIPDWDDIIGSYGSKQLFHETSWLRFLKKSQGAAIQGLKLLDRERQVVGYFCAGEVRKGPFRLLGSPLQGWTTTFMGPIVDNIHAESLLDTLAQYCRARGVDYIELANPTLPASTMYAAGYELDPDTSLVVTIDDEKSMWSRLESKSCRYCINRAKKTGLSVERTTDPAIVPQYYRQLQQVFQRQALVPTYGEDRVRVLWDSLMPVGRLLAVRVWHGDEVIATGLFPFDDRVIYFWGGASQVRAYSLYPNELLQWNVMLFALEKGIPLYHMGGGGTFKQKFGGTTIVIERWFKPLSPLARVGRNVFKYYVSTKQRLLGHLNRGFSQESARSAP